VGDQSSSEKRCVVCGQDCAGQPRTKDAKGQYFHKECYERRRQELRAAAQAPEPSGADAADPFDVAQVPAAAVTRQVCPSCGFPIDPAAVICTNCGYNLATGAAIGAPLIVAAPRSAGWRAWPGVIGITSCVLGGSGTALYAVELILTLPAIGSAGGRGVGVAGILTGLSLSLWLLACGIGIIRHRRTAPTQIRRWAWTKIILYSTCLTCATIGVGALPSGNSPALEELGGGTPPPTGLLIAILLGMLLWFLLWPIVVLIWFGRQSIKAEVSHWT
jgi:hypothetical protein